MVVIFQFNCEVLWIGNPKMILFFVQFYKDTAPYIIYCDGGVKTIH